MDVNTFAKRLWALWLAIPMTALNYWLVWNHLPSRIAMHWDATGRPNSWASPDEARTFTLGFLAFVLVMVMAVGHLVAYSRPDRARPALILLYIAVCLICALLNGFVWFNLA
jgi:uncharacterized membrane protein